MKKVKVGKRILDAYTVEEYAQTRCMNPKDRAGMIDDGAIIYNDHVYPLNRQYNANVVGATDYGVMMRLSEPKNELAKNPDYNAKNVIDFSDTKGLKAIIQKQAMLDQAERSILISPDNIYQTVIQENDTPEMKLLKEAINRKHIDLDNYKQRFGSDFNNDKRLFEQSSITFFKLKRMCEILDIQAELTFRDKPNAPNPIGDVLSTQITSSKATDDIDDEGD